MDQANTLRDLVSRVRGSVETPLVHASAISVTSGKGGVGKSNFSIFLAKTLSSMGKEVLLFDGDLGLANLHILMGVSAPYSLSHVLSGEKSIEEVIYKTRDNLDILPGNTGNADIANLSAARVKGLVEQLEAHSSQYDYLIVDGGAGIGDGPMSLAYAGDTIIVVLTPEPTSLADAYSVIKLLNARGRKDFSVVVNMADSLEEAETIFEKLSLITERYLGFKPRLIGILPRSKQLTSCIREERSVLSDRGLGNFTIAMNGVAKAVLDNSKQPEISFFEKLFM